MASRPQPIVYQSRAQLEAAVANGMKKVLGFKRKARPNLPQTAPLYIFNLSDKEFKWHQPGFDFYVIKACQLGQEYSEPLAIPGIVVEEYLKVDETELNLYNAGEIVAAILGFGAGIRPESDLRNFGVFASATNPPHQDEIEEAQKRMIKTCQSLFWEGNRINSEGQSRATNGAGGQMISDDMRWAAYMLGQKVDWNKSPVLMRECPQCGGPVSASASVHFGHDGCGAVLPGKWRDAVASGLKSKQQWMEAAPMLSAEDRPEDYESSKSKK